MRQIRFDQQSVTVRRAEIRSASSTRLIVWQWYWINGHLTASASKAKALYLVGACPVLHDHEVYQPGDELELTEAEAARLGGKVTAATT